MKSFTLTAFSNHSEEKQMSILNFFKGFAVTLGKL